VPLVHILDSAPSLLWQPDVGWITRAGEDAPGWLRRFAGRIRTAHLKDVAADADNGEGGWADVGYGIVDWPGVVAMLADPATGTLFVEHDDPSDYVRLARRSRETVAGWPVPAKR
jgi:sugar phosphate isomerase/epimerase